MDGGTADKVVELRSKNPLMKAAEMARELEVSRERVRQVLVKRGLPTVPCPKLCFNCSHHIYENNKTGFCQRCLKELSLTFVCSRCGRKFRSTLLESGGSKLCRDCRKLIRRRQMRLCALRREWEYQKKRHKHRCIFCQGVFDSAGEFSAHRVDTKELNDPDFRKWVVTYRSTHSYWKTLEYFHISQETYKAIRDGKEAPAHH
jgi:hypothetical protein